MPARSTRNIEGLPCTCDWSLPDEPGTRPTAHHAARRHDQAGQPVLGHRGLDRARSRTPPGPPPRSGGVRHHGGQPGHADRLRHRQQAEDHAGEGPPGHRRQRRTPHPPRPHGLATGADRPVVPARGKPLRDPHLQLLDGELRPPDGRHRRPPHGRVPRRGRRGGAHRRPAAHQDGARRRPRGGDRGRLQRREDVPDRPREGRRLLRRWPRRDPRPRPLHPGRHQQ